MPYLSPYIETLRQKPLHVRQRHTLVWSAGLTAIILAVWWSAAIFKEESVATRSTVVNTGPITSLVSVVRGEVEQIIRGAKVIFNK